MSRHRTPKKPFMTLLLTKRQATRLEDAIIAYESILLDKGKHLSEEILGISDELHDAFESL